jgi:peptide-methionine (R)-S-oxide reductase
MNRRVFVLLMAAMTLWMTLSSHAQDEFGRKVRKVRKVQKTDAQWARELTQDQFMVTRRKATEPAFSGKYVNNHAKGIYVCVCCGTELFASNTKFNSGTGWPSFWKPISPKNVDTEADYSLAEERVEVMCNTCGAHLGHVFTDGPPPTGLRYCMNSVALKFIKAGSAKKEAEPKKDASKDEKAAKDGDTPAKDDDKATKGKEADKP